MANFVTMSKRPDNEYVVGLITEPNNPFPVRWETPVTLKYYFDNLGIRVWTDAEKQAAADAFASWSKVANIDFELTTSQSEANIYQTLNESQEFAGATSAPADGINPPTIFYSVFNGSFDTITKGGHSFSVMVHEIGHVIGLYHPHSGNTFPGVPLNANQNTGTNGQNQSIWSVMSYVIGWTGEPTQGLGFGHVIGPMAFDIAAAQFLYGARAAETGDNLYALPGVNGTGTGWKAIWDTGGSDAIDGRNNQGNMTIDLRDAPLVGENAGGYVSWIHGVKGGFTIANGVVIENAYGGNGNDSLTGNETANRLDGGAGADALNGGGGNDTLIGGLGNDRLEGGAGNDRLEGNDGIDYAVIQGARGSVTMTKQSDGSYLLTTQDQGVDTLIDVERLSFSDGTLALDIAGNAGQAYRIYKAAFARDPDNDGLKYWIGRVDNGTGLIDVAKGFLASTEFQTLYGTNPSNEAFIAKLYNNVLGREGEAGGFAFWQGELDSGNRDMARVLADFSESAENIAGVAPSINDGIWYV